LARIPRVSPIGVSQHIIHQVCFASEQDFAACINWKKEYAGGIMYAISIILISELELYPVF
jgi:hypothetical protein